MASLHVLTALLKWVLAVSLILRTAAQNDGRARCRLLFPVYTTSADEAQYVAGPGNAWDGRVFASKHSNGPDSMDFLRLSFQPGMGLPVHRHFDAEEWIYVLSGTGIYSYWALENVFPTDVEIAPGHVLYNPQGQLHKIFNDGNEPLVILAVSKGLTPYEVLEDWPESAEGGVGVIPEVQPWETSCAPGHELSEEEIAEYDNAAEGEEGFGEGEFDDGDAERFAAGGEEAWGLAEEPVRQPPAVPTPAGYEQYAAGGQGEGEYDAEGEEDDDDEGCMKAADYPPTSAECFADPWAGEDYNEPYDENDDDDDEPGEWVWQTVDVTVGGGEAAAAVTAPVGTEGGDATPAGETAGAGEAEAAAAASSGSHTAREDGEL